MKPVDNVGISQGYPQVLFAQLKSQYFNPHSYPHYPQIFQQVFHILWIKLTRILHYFNIAMELFSINRNSRNLLLFSFHPNTHRYPCSDNPPSHASLILYLEIPILSLILLFEITNLMKQNMVNIVLLE